MNETVEIRLFNRAENANNINELVEVCDSIIEEIINSDERVYSFDKIKIKIIKKK